MNRLRYCCLLLLPLVAQASEFLLPLDLRPDTNATFAWQAGIPGGIPTIATAINAKTDYGAVGNGVTDDTLAVSNALASATSGQAVYLPSGTYLVSNVLRFVTSSTVLRGAGPAATRIISWRNTGSPDAAIYCAGSGSSSNKIYAGYRGSSNVAMISISSLAVGRWVSVKQSYDTSLIFGTTSHDPPYIFQSQDAKIAAIDGTNVTLSRPLYWDYTNTAFAPYISQRSYLTNCGVENLTLQCQGTAGIGILFFLAGHCWVTNVVVTNAYAHGFTMFTASGCNIQRCSAHYTRAAASGYGIQLCAYSTDNLIENNTVDGHTAGVLIQGGSSGNVAAYNFVNRSRSFTDLNSGIICHGDFANFNLFEGNNVTMMTCDNFWGNNTRNTFFRNWSRAHALNQTNAEVTSGLQALKLDATNYLNGFVGNVLCLPGDTSPPRTTYVVGKQQDNLQSPPFDYSATNIVWGSNFFHGNWEYIASAVTWWSNGFGQQLPSSLYLSAKPAWYGNWTWPPFGQDVIGYTNTIPAEARWNSTPEPVLWSATRVNVGRLIRH